MSPPPGGIRRRPGTGQRLRRVLGYLPDDCHRLLPSVRRSHRSPQARSSGSGAPAARND